MTSESEGRDIAARLESPQTHVDHVLFAPVIGENRHVDVLREARLAPSLNGEPSNQTCR